MYWTLKLLTNMIHGEELYVATLAISWGLTKNVLAAAIK
jgi:hypothetical protein